jgi:uncharacterized protein
MHPPRPDAPGPTLGSIHVYPLKSARGISVSEARVDRIGLEHDRRWMLLDERGAFMSLRTHERMALLRTALTESSLHIEAPGLEPLTLPLEESDGGPVARVQVWREKRHAVDCGDEPAAWASEAMGERCRVVRAVAPPDGSPETPDGWVLAGFADAQAALMISQASLDDLNARLPEPLRMDRFRPNLVVSGAEPYAEDRVGELRIGSVAARALRPCARCAATTVDSETATRGKEPLRTLATYRRGRDGAVYFGMNTRFEGEGVLRVGDPIVPSEA